MLHISVSTYMVSGKKKKFLILKSIFYCKLSAQLIPYRFRLLQDNYNIRLNSDSIRKDANYGNGPGVSTFLPVQCREK
jgi:hypothetical protein